MAENSLLNKLSDVVRIAEQSEEEIRERIKSIGEDLETYKVQIISVIFSSVRYVFEAVLHVGCV